MLSRCFASEAMTTLLAWRNPNGVEENWLYLDQRPRSVNKVIVTEVTLPLLATIAAVEGVVYFFLCIPAALMAICDDRPVKFLASRVNSSLFTFTWAISDLLWNPLVDNLLTDEYLIKYWLGNNDPSVRHYAQRWEETNGINLRQDRRVNNPPPPAQGVDDVPQGLGARLELGTEFLANEVFAGLDDVTLTEIVDVYSDRGDIVRFVLTRALFIYVFGIRRNDQVPHFLKIETIRAIRLLRREFGQLPPPNELWDYLSDLERFEKGPDSAHPAKMAYDRLKNSTAEELLGSDFLMGCWQRALELRLYFRKTQSA